MLQGCFTLLVVALRPYISVVLNMIEISCSCLEVAILGLTTAAYLYINGNIQQQRDSHLRVGVLSCKAGPGMLLQMDMGRAQAAASITY